MKFSIQKSLHFSILNFISQSSILKFISHWSVAISDLEGGNTRFQYDFGIPRTFCPRNASTMLLLTGAATNRRVSRNFLSIS